MKDFYHEGYFERAEGSNYRNYGDDFGWDTILGVLNDYKVFLPPNPTLLEVACAKGFFVAHALDWGWNAWGFDISEYAISAAFPPVRNRVVIHDATEPWSALVSEGIVDVLVGWEFFEHIDEAAVDLVWREMVRAVRPGGFIVLKIGMPNGEPDHDVTHVTMHDRSWWDERLTDWDPGEGSLLYAVEPMPELVEQLDAAFAGRDWAGRFFAYRRVFAKRDA